MNTKIPVKQKSFDLNACIDFLKKNQGLVSVKTQVDPHYELAGVAKHFEGGKQFFLKMLKTIPTLCLRVFTGIAIIYQAIRLHCRAITVCTG